ncbi:MULTISPECIES: helix-turn-helix transcriptional regulator [unclassified Actinobaculum]|uniref:helix-turn-helix transcriptional regulator n=1 Tax=unclassified Actinobaculum TaxID=2609299 RepID=UPI000D52A6E2|nr:MULTISPECIES: helix-turn-helix transcriptional regulator [unclassified Actinobaculum]AWE41886.1 transcriptional regulator [Actinobaculum sp. 313]RTE50199.1 transcriptional regulator [Actinobaculum sp. 352]
MRNRLAELRKSCGWSQEHLAEVLGVSRQTVISIEKGKFSPSLPLAFLIAATFDLRIEDVFFPDP